ncbi:hypothetical protein ACVMGC_007442 [Bradyrhizobium barranii subsp. barranii]
MRDRDGRDRAELGDRDLEVRKQFQQEGLELVVGAPVGRSKSPGYGHLKLPHLMIAVSAAEQQ